jgi:hypothetical protein
MYRSAPIASHDLWRKACGQPSTVEQKNFLKDKLKQQQQCTQQIIVQVSCGVGLVERPYIVSVALNRAVF